MFFNQAKIVQQKTKHDKKEDNNKIVHSQRSSLCICHRERVSIRDLKRFKSYFMRLAGSRKGMSKLMEMMPKKLSFLAAGLFMKVDVGLWMAYSSTQQKR